MDGFVAGWAWLMNGFMDVWIATAGWVFLFLPFFVCIVRCLYETGSGHVRFGSKLHGCMDAWIYDGWMWMCISLWMHGCRVVWMHGRVDACI